MRFTPLYICLAALLTGCAVATASVDPKPELDGMGGTSGRLASAKWMDANRDEIVARARDYIHRAHPAVDADFPRIHVRQVSFYDYQGVALAAGKGQAEMTATLQSLSDGILGTRAGAPTWEADVEVRSARGSDAVGAINGVLLVPDIYLCFTTIFVVCPAVEQHEVVMVTHLTLPDGRKLDLVAGGAGIQVESTLMLEDNPRSMDEMFAKALSAAIVGTADKLVEAYKSDKH